jgi:hypothetical protein
MSDADTPSVPTHGPLQARLSIEAGEPLRGTIALDGEPGDVVPFRGWIELMAAISEARAPSPPAADR